MSANSDVVHKNYTKLIYKILIELKKSDIYKNRELKRLSKAVSESLSKNWKKIDSDERVKISFEVRQILTENSPNSHIEIVKKVKCLIHFRYSWVRFVYMSRSKLLRLRTCNSDSRPYQTIDRKLHTAFRAYRTTGIFYVI